jgi:hypothetical protein
LPRPKFFLINALINAKETAMAEAGATNMILVTCDLTELRINILFEHKISIAYSPKRIEFCTYSPIFIKTSTPETQGAMESSMSDKYENSAQYLGGISHIQLVRL